MSRRAFLFCGGLGMYLSLVIVWLADNLLGDLSGLYVLMFFCLIGAGQCFVFPYNYFTLWRPFDGRDYYLEYISAAWSWYPWLRLGWLSAKFNCCAHAPKARRSKIHLLLGSSRIVLQLIALPPFVGFHC